jgi:hypothetical protein
MATGESERTAEAASRWTTLDGTTDVTPLPVAFDNRLYLFARGAGDEQVLSHAVPLGDGANRRYRRSGTRDRVVGDTGNASQTHVHVDVRQ